MISDNELLFNSLKLFYKDDYNLTKLLNYLKVDKISLRIIDWFVTNYSKKYNIFYSIFLNENDMKTFDSKDYNDKGNKHVRLFNTYHSYKSQLKSYSKKKFDPFCRRERINFYYDDKKYIVTTVGQLNFFKWAIENLIIDYILLHYSEIEQDMNQSYNQIKKHKKKSNERKKRQELSKSATRGLNNTNMKVILDFN